MIMEEFSALKESIVAMVTIFGTGNLLSALRSKGNTILNVALYVYEPDSNRYSLIRDSECSIEVYVDQYMGPFSDDGRVEMACARVKEGGGIFKMFPKGARICVCYDTMLGKGCIRSVRSENGQEQELAIPGYLKGYNFDGDPVELISSEHLSDVIKRKVGNPSASQSALDPAGGNAKTTKSSESSATGASTSASSGRSDAVEQGNATTATPSQGSIDEDGDTAGDGGDLDGV